MKLSVYLIHRQHKWLKSWADFNEILVVALWHAGSMIFAIKWPQHHPLLTKNSLNSYCDSNSNSNNNNSNKQISIAPYASYSDFVCCKKMTTANAWQLLTHTICEIIYAQFYKHLTKRSSLHVTKLIQIPNGAGLTTNYI